MTEADLTKRLLAEVEVLRERVRQLEAILMPDKVRVPVEWSLTPSEAKVFVHLVSRDLCTKESILLAIYSDRIDAAPEPKIVDVFICKIRRKLTPFGIAINTVWGQGFCLQDRDRFIGGLAA